MPQYERGKNPTIDQMVDDAVMKLINEARGSSETFSFSVASTRSVDPRTIIQRGAYRWNGISEATTILAAPPRLPFEYTREVERMQTASESKQEPKIEDLPPVFKREIDI